MRVTDVHSHFGNDELIGLQLAFANACTELKFDLSEQHKRCRAALAALIMEMGMRERDPVTIQRRAVMLIRSLGRPPIARG